MKRVFVRKRTLREEHVAFLRTYGYVVLDGGELWIVECAGLVEELDLSVDPEAALEHVATSRMLIPGDANITWWDPDVKPSGGGARVSLGRYGPLLVHNRKKPGVNRAEEMAAISYAARQSG